MSTTVAYKGETLTTVSNATKVLETGGTWMEGDLTLTDSTTRVVETTVTVPSGHWSTAISFAALGEPTMIVFSLIPDIGSSNTTNSSHYVHGYYDGESCKLTSAISYGETNGTRLTTFSGNVEYENGVVTIYGERTYFPSNITYTVVYAYEP